MQRTRWGTLSFVGHTGRGIASKCLLAACPDMRVTAVQPSHVRYGPLTDIRSYFYEVWFRPRTDLDRPDTRTNCQSVCARR